MNETKANLLATLIGEIDDSESWAPFETKYFGPSTRALSFFKEVDAESALVLVSQLEHLAYTDPEAPITLYINTPGGSLTDAFAIYDCIVNLSCPVLIISTGLCASAGLLILLAGDYKLATVNTTFFYHQPVFTQTSSVSSSKDMETLSSHYKHCQEKVDKVLKSTCSITAAQWKKNFNNSTGYYFDTTQALKYKLINKVITPDKVEFEIDEVVDS